MKAFSTREGLQGTTVLGAASKGCLARHGYVPTAERVGVVTISAGSTGGVCFVAVVCYNLLKVVLQYHTNGMLYFEFWEWPPSVQSR